MSRLIILLALLFAVAAAGAEIRGTAFANWYVLGEEARFEAKKPLEGTELAVTVFDSAGKKVHSTTLPAAEFNRSGWGWQAPNPGFYEAEFLLDGKAVSESYPVGISRQDPADKRKWRFVTKQDFTVVRHGFAVAPGKTPEPQKISPHFGASPHMSMYKNAIPLARLVGFSSIRIHAIRWDTVEKEKGRINWDGIDGFMRLARENGYRDEDIIFNIYGTPRWASTRPEADWINIFIPEYISVVPKDMTAWTSFIQAVMRRYPGVKRYELWNEPHLIGFSCFWNDSVENFIALLKAGYETVKEEKPDATVWLGGIGMRYLPFYDEFLKAGGGNYFDVLPLHGSWVKPEPFHELEKKYGLAPKPVVSSEWHAMLLKPYDSEFPSEQLLSRNMLLDFLNQIRSGVTEVDFFCLLNLYRSEKEALPFHREHRSHTTHVSGLFRQVPYIQPRYPALAWHVFTMQVAGKLRVGEGYQFRDSEQQAVMLESDSGPMLLVWNGGTEAASASPELRRAFGPASKLLNAEGAEISSGVDFRLIPETYYFVRNPERKAIDNWSCKTEVLLPQRAKPELEHLFNGAYRPGKLFDAKLDILDPQTLAWQPFARTVIWEKQLPPGNVKGRFAAALNKETFELLVEVEDPVHFCEAADMKVWEFDSLQFAIDTRGEGFSSDRLEFAAARNSNGEAALWKVTAPNLGGDLPGRFTPAGDRVAHARCRIDRQNGRTVYRISLDNSELYPWSAAEQPAMRFSLLVNNNDGQGRAAYVEWGSGIGNAKAPKLYGNLTPQLPPGAVLTQEDLKHKGWNKDDYQLEFAGKTVRVIGSSPLCSGVATRRAPVVSGGLYRVTLEVRGAARFQVMAGGDNFKRIDLLNQTPLTEEWKRFDLTLRIPPGSNTASVTCFAWNQPGCRFEIRNFRMEPFSR